MTPNFSFFNFFLATEFMKINANYDIFVQEEPQIIDLCIVPFIGTVDSSSQYTLGNVFFHYIKSYEDRLRVRALLGEGFVFLIFSILARRHELPLLAFLVAKLDIFFLLTAK